MTKLDGGPAFPYKVDGLATVIPHNNPGMSLRDYFAAHAPIPVDLSYEGPYEGRVNDTVRWRYVYADAMLAERMKP